jgi:putative endonuclease
LPGYTLDPAIHHAKWLVGCTSLRTSQAAHCTLASPTISRRVAQHRDGIAEGFTKRYGIKMLVFYEEHDTVPLAIQREKNIKHWPREWKIDLIVSLNPGWRDLYSDICF